MNQKFYVNHIVEVLSCQDRTQTRTLSKLISTLNLHLCQHLYKFTMKEVQTICALKHGVPSTLAVKLQSQFQTDEKGHCTDEIRIYSNEQDTPNWSAHILYSGIVEASQEAMWKHFAGPGFSVHNPFHLAKCGLCRVLLVPLHARLFPQLFTVSPRTNETIILIHTWS